MKFKFIALLFVSIQGVSAAYAADPTEIRCNQILRNYSLIAAKDDTIPKLPTRFKAFKDSFDTEEIDGANGAVINMTCLRNGVLDNFDIHFATGTPRETVRKQFVAILASMRTFEKASKFLDELIDRALKSDPKRAADDFGKGTNVSVYFDTPASPSMIVDRTEANGSSH